MNRLLCPDIAWKRPRHSRYLLYNIQKQRDYSRVQKVDEHCADDWDNEERLHGVMIFVADSVHVCHRVGRCAKAEATDTSDKDGCVVVGTEHTERNEIGYRYHNDHLRHQYKQQGEGKGLQFPEFKRHHCHAEEER